jgi:8-amino-7-oxononanoate synthase
VATEPERPARLHALVRHAEARLAALGLPASGSQILPVVIGDNARAMRVAGALQAAGFDVRGIRPPTVPQGTARLRIAITLNVAESDIDAMTGALADAMAAA